MTKMKSQIIVLSPTSPDPDPTVGA